ncbi:SDR family oxidoreductase [Actinomadura rayongensis]|uniref:SDR family NAD(P)-dependent oxidoreductase n=1 Tax=Actinomadura rayongensis TaxID=1429076 RepID=A0A6I4W805_9ACTN|nr:SDR family oxidoreductase [Actinomadura rayongensis]MXQ63284.1 SDR family NAD(P)-dependent oxidoreductase [Actinomadura rayongensis]
MSKVIAITGAARGIGFATARALSDRGAHVALGDVDEAAVRAAGDRLGAPAFALDVTARASFTAFLDAVEDAFGPLSVLINNAGIMPIGPLTEESDEDARRCLDVNVHGVMLGTKLAVARMEPRGRGHVVNIASLAGVLPTPGLALYNASKAAVVAFTEAARLEVLDRGLHVSAVLPSFTATELIAGTRSPKGMPNNTPEEVAAAVVDLVARPRPQVVVPRRLASRVRLGALLPDRVRRAAARRYGLDTLFLDYDAEARRAYDERIRGGA